MIPRRTLVATLALLPLAGPALVTPALAHSYKAGGVRVGHPWGRPSDGPEADVFVALLNTGEAPDRLIGATTPVAAAVTIVDEVEGRLSPVETLALAPKRPVPMRPGARALRLSGLVRPLKLGDRFPLTLRFERAGAVEVEIYVEEAPGH